LATTTAAFDLKSTAWTLTVLRLQTADTAALARALAERFGDSPGLFDGDAVVIDLGPLRDGVPCPDFAALLPLLRRIGMLPVGVQGGSAAQTREARRAGLPEAMDAAPAAARTDTPALVREIIREVEVVREVEVPREVPTPVPPLVVDKPLRSGQRVYARGGDLIVTAVVSFGAEVIADGNVHVYAPLRGRAIAGARGDTAARIWSTCLEPQLISVAGIYRTTETELPDNVRSKPACVRLDGERLIIEPVGQ
jgi:septum site-determining protein MinC